MNLKDLVPVLQLAIGPVIVISGVGLVLLSMTNRYGRVIDRSRHLADDVRGAGGGEAAARAATQLAILVRRAHLLRLSIILASTSLLLAALLIIGLFITALIRAENASVIAVLFVGCMGSLIASLAVFIYDINLSLTALDVEVGDAAKSPPVGG
jgi:hypothetical protein